MSDTAHQAHAGKEDADFKAVLSTASNAWCHRDSHSYVIKERRTCLGARRLFLILLAK